MDIGEYGIPGWRCSTPRIPWGSICIFTVPIHGFLMIFDGQIVGEQKYVAVMAHRTPNLAKLPLRTMGLCMYRCTYLYIYIFKKICRYTLLLSCHYHCMAIDYPIMFMCLNVCFNLCMIRHFVSNSEPFKCVYNKLKANPSNQGHLGSRCTMLSFFQPFCFCLTGVFCGVFRSTGEEL